MNSKTKLQNALTESIEKLFQNTVANINLTSNTNLSYGDFSTNFALTNAKKLGMNAVELAEKIKTELLENDFIEKIEIVGPGFMNFFLKNNIVSELLEKIIKSTFDNTANSKTKIVIEHTSVNPNKSMHIGHIRNSVLGDSIARIYRKLGYKVEVQNYIDDTGLQVADTTNAILNLGKNEPSDQSFDDFCWDIYAEINSLYPTRKDLLEKRQEISHALETGNNETSDKAKKIVDKILDCHLELLADFGIYFDLLVYESDILKFGFWQNAFSNLKKSPNFFLETEGKQSGCWILRYEDKKLPNKIFVKSTGITTYVAKDVGYHLWKFGLLEKDFTYEERPFKPRGTIVSNTSISGSNSSLFGKADRVVNLVDERQSYPQEMVKFSLKSLGYTAQSDNFFHLAYGVVNLSIETAKSLGLEIVEGQKSYTMSGRKGIGVKVKDLLNLTKEKISALYPANDEKTNHTLAVLSIKHFVLKFNPASEIIFDVNTSISLNGNTGPYLMYSFVRANSILKKAGEFEYQFTPESGNESEEKLAKLLGSWDEILTQVGKSMSVSLILEYAFKLSSEFHSFYEKNSVLKAEEDLKKFRLTLVFAFRKILVEIFEILGVNPLEKM